HHRDLHSFPTRRSSDLKMKINILSIFLVFLMTTGAVAQVDRSKQPEPGPAPKINLGEPESFTLKNGLRVMVVENHKLPRVTASRSEEHTSELQSRENLV